MKHIIELQEITIEEGKDMLLSENYPKSGFYKVERVIKNEYSQDLIFVDKKQPTCFGMLHLNGVPAAEEHITAEWPVQEATAILPVHELRSDVVSTDFVLELVKTIVQK